MWLIIYSFLKLKETFLNKLKLLLFMDVGSCLPELKQTNGG